MSQYKCIDDLQLWLDSYLNFEKTPQKNIFWLKTMEFLCQSLGNPQNAIPAFHVAGSKGKGSTASFIASILDYAGFKTGLYTSPHIIDFMERITSYRGFFPENVYQKAAEELKEKVLSIAQKDFPQGRPLTWFELVTVYAFLTFRQAKCDYSVFEVGLGGRLDSTNVISPLISVISTIELEHTEFLGDTLEKIAGEKAGIIKKNTPVIVAPQKESVKEVFRKKAIEENSKIYFLDEIIKDFSTSLKNDGKIYQEVTFKSDLFSRPLSAKLSMLGEFQSYNAMLAALAVKIALPQITEKEIEGGLSRAKLPARFEIIKNPAGYADIPYLILDGAHTVKSIDYTIKTMREIFDAPPKKNDSHSYPKKDASFVNKNLLFACAADKDVEDIAPLFADYFDRIYLTKPGNVKISDMEKMKAAFDKAGLPYSCDEDFQSQIKKALESCQKNKSILLVTGSFYLVSEVKKILQG